MTQSGHLVISDISGYTAFLTQAELEHAHDILKNLFQNLVDHTRLPLMISKFEGDAIFSYTLAGSFLQGQTLVEMIENIYCEFARARENMRRNTTCTCKACSLIPALDLKFVVHHGEFIVGDMGGREEVSGPDVIAVHWLLKNTVKEDTGVEAYAFFSGQSAEALKLGEMCADMTPHTENYEHLGDVPGYVYDLHAIWENERQRRRVKIESANTWFTVETDVPVSPELAWDYLTEPTLRQGWLHADRLTESGRRMGRSGIGTKSHCAHGKENSFFTVEDWRPFEYVTYQLMVMDGVVLQEMNALMPIGGGTRVTWVVSRNFKGKGAIQNLMIPVVKPLIKPGTFKTYQKNAIKFREMILEDLAAGKIVAGVEATKSPQSEVLA
jgi:uncharacterized protein DUF2652